jgi:hypothetical protein
MPDDPQPPDRSGAPEQPKYVEPGQWWWGIACARCQEFLAFVYDRHGPDSRLAFLGEPGALIEISCFACRWTGRYDVPRMEKREYLSSEEWGPPVARGQQVE